MNTPWYQELVQKKYFKLFILLLIPVFYYFYSFGNFDLAPSDDDVYFQTGLLFELPYPTFGNLLYPMGIYIFSKFFQDHILLSYSYTFLLSVALFFSLFLFLRKNIQSFWIAIFVAMAFLFSDFQVNLQPRITVLNLIFGLSFLSIIDLKRPAYINWGITSVGLLLCNYVSRPEFFWFFVLSSLIFAYYTFTNSFISSKRKITVGLSFAAFVALFYFIGGGINEPGKLKVAFIQHFFDNYYDWYGKSFDYDEEFVVFEKIFGKTNSDLQLITANPTFFFKHVLTNAKNYVSVVILILKSGFYDLFTPFFQFKTKYFFLVFILFFGAFIDYKKTVNAILTSLKNAIKTSPYLIAFLLPTCIAVLVVYPRHHYVIMHMPLYLLLVAIFIKSISFRKNSFTNGLPKLFSLIFIAGFFGYYPYKKAEPRHTDFYYFMKEIGTKKQIEILSNDIFGQNYFNENYHRTGWDPKKDNLVDMLNSGNYDVLSFYFLDLEVPENRAFLKEGSLKTKMIRIKTYEPLKRYIWVKPELVGLFKNQ
ncbi:hypothetical protein [Lacihabitans lacunae]|uniref:Glycosyltransferase RgtA/B/C/D-like domain-containing protein n=1 Tax=Lacihabitans lacunae TaxID=1028214 RepID=A0ABV7Z229_9BACT